MRYPVYHSPEPRRSRCQVRACTPAPTSAPRWSAPIDGQPGRGPRVEAAHDVGRAVQPEVRERGGGQAGRVALGAEHDDLHVVAGRRRDPVVAGRVEPPLEDVPLDHDRLRHLALGRALGRRADVDEQRARRQGVPRVGRVEPVQPGTGVGQDVVDGPAARHLSDSGSSVSTVRDGTRVPSGAVAQYVIRVSGGE